jgi:hypothetical protein
MVEQESKDANRDGIIVTTVFVIGNADVTQQQRQQQQNR